MAINSINKAAGSIFEKSLSGKGFISKKFNHFFSKQFDKAVNDPAKFAAAMLVTSIVSKDAVGCVLYTTQSLSNKKIPEDKRPAVASLDLMNGILMVGGQLIAGKIVERRLTPQLFGKIYSGFFKNKDTGKEEELKGIDAKAKSRLYDDNLLDTVKATIKEKGEAAKGLDAEKIAKAVKNEIGHGSKRYKLFEAGFGIVVTALATTALVKRTLVPLVSTPLSAWFKEKVMDKKLPKQEDRLYYEAAAVAAGKYDNKMDKVAFSQVASK